MWLLNFRYTPNQHQCGWWLEGFCCISLVQLGYACRGCVQAPHLQIVHHEAFLILVPNQTTSHREQQLWLTGWGYHDLLRSAGLILPKSILSLLTRSSQGSQYCEPLLGGTFPVWIGQKIEATVTLLVAVPLAIQNLIFVPGMFFSAYHGRLDVVCQLLEHFSSLCLRLYHRAVGTSTIPQQFGGYLRLSERYPAIERDWASLDTTVFMLIRVLLGRIQLLLLPLHWRRLSRYCPWIQPFHYQHQLSWYMLNASALLWLRVRHFNRGHRQNFNWPCQL